MNVRCLAIFLVWHAAVEVGLERHVGEGEGEGERRRLARLPLLSESRVVWECSPKWVVDSI